MACEINNENIKKAIINQVSKMLNDSGLFEKVDINKNISAIYEGKNKEFAINGNHFFIRNGVYEINGKEVSDNEFFNNGFNEYLDSIKNSLENTFEPKDSNSTFEDVIDDINNQFGEEIITKTDDGYKISPTESLIANYENFAKDSDIWDSEAQKFESYDDKNVRQEAGLDENSTPEDFIRDNMQQFAKQIDIIKKANSSVLVEFSDETSRYDPNSNKVFISLPELYDVYNKLKQDIPFKQIVSNMILHEMEHAGLSHAIETGNNKDIVKSFLNKVKEYHKTTPFIDHMREGYIQSGEPYAFQDEHEFASEAMSNPFFQEYLRKVPDTNEKTIWQSFLDFLKKILRLSETPSMYDEVIKFLNSDKIRQQNSDGLEYSSAEWNPQLSYRGLPANYVQGTYNFFTSTAIKDEVSTILRKLPSVIVKIKNSLDNETNPDERKSLQRLLASYNDLKKDDNITTVSINMLTQVAQISKDLNLQLVDLNKMEDGDKKLSLSYSLYQQAKSLEFVEPIIKDILYTIDKAGEPANIKTFTTQLRGVSSVISSIKNTYNKVNDSSIVKLLTDNIGETESEKRLKKELAMYRDQLSKTTDSGTRMALEGHINIRLGEMKFLPTKENFESIAAGLYEDASSTQMLFESATMNGHPLAGALMGMLTDNNREVHQLMLPIENRHQIALNEFKKGLGKNFIRDTKDIYKPIYDEFEYIDGPIKEKEDGSLDIKYSKMRMFTSEYHPDFLKQALTKQAAKNFYFEKLSESLSNDNEADTNKYKAKLSDAYKDLRNFYKENCEEQYDQDITDMYDLLQKDIVKEDGTITSFSKERGNMFQEIEDLERDRDLYTLIDDKDRSQELINEAYTRLAQIKSKFDFETGVPKQGFDLELSNIANQYSDLKSKNGVWELNDQGRGLFEKDMANLKNRLDRGYINQDEYNRRLGTMTVTELSDDYYKASKYYSDQISQLSTQLSAISEFRSIFKGVNNDKIKEGYEKIRDLVKGFRDNDLTIDGQLFSRVRPEMVKEIQSIQQETENLRAVAEKMKGLSIDDVTRLRALQKAKNKGTLSGDDLNELNGLVDKQNKQNQVYEQNKDLIEKYSSLLSALAELNETTNTSYYNDELETRKALLKKERTGQLVDQLKTLTSIEGGKYIKSSDGTWSKVLGTDGGYKVIEKVPITEGFSSPEESIANDIAQTTIDEDIKGTEWYKNNHFQKNVWNNKQKTFVKQDNPIYIWVKTAPKDKSLILSQQPSIKYKTYKINDGHENSDYKELNNNIPVPRKGKFTNEKYEDLKKKNDHYFKYLEFLRKESYSAQRYYSQHVRLGDILPSFTKTNDESHVDLTNALAGRMTNLLTANLKIGLGASKDTDEQILTGGSTSNFFAKNRKLPTRFVNKMNSDKQSADLPAMILGLTTAALEYNKMLEDQPLAEAIRSKVENLSVIENKSLASKFSPAALFNTVKSKWNNTESDNSITREKQTPQTNLSKTVNFILDTYIYGETRFSANVDLGGVDFDLNKASSLLRKFASNSIFLGSLFLPIKNTMLVAIQANIQSNIGKGFFTRAQYNKGHAEAVGFTKDLLSDFTKFGNKSQIGQETDFFSVFQGASYNEYGHKTAFTPMKNIKTGLMSVKSSMEIELQLSQYLAMSKANPVMVNGQLVEFRKAFRLDKEKGMIPVDGANITQKDINDFVKKVVNINRTLNGAYRAEEKNALQKNILGGLAFYLNGFLVPGITARFSKTRFSPEGDMISMGYHRQMFQFIGDLIKFKMEIGKKWAVMNADEKNRVLRSITELGAIMAMALLVSALGGNKNKQDLQDQSAMRNWLLSMSIAVKSQTETFIPLPGMGLNDLSSKLNSPFVAMKQITAILKTTQDVTSWMVGSDDAVFKATSNRDGLHEKGDNKAVSDFLKLAGYSGHPFDPVSRVIDQKKAITLK